LRFEEDIQFNCSLDTLKGIGETSVSTIKRKTNNRPIKEGGSSRLMTLRMADSM